MNGLLFLAHRLPYPPKKGDKIRAFRELSYLSEHYDVYLGTFVDDPADWQYVEHIRALCKHTCIVALNPRLATARCALGLLRGEALSVRYYRNQKLARWVRGIVTGGQIDHIVAYSSAMAQFVPVRTAHDAGVVVDFVDVDSEKWRLYGAQRRGPKGWIYRREARRLLEFDGNAAQNADSSIFVSDVEADLFRQLVPQVGDRVHCVENGVDTVYFDPFVEYANPYHSGSTIILFSGAMDYWPNVDAVSWFAREIFPALRTRIADARFVIAGARPTSKVQALEHQDGVVVTGYVDDMRPYLKHADVSVAPLRVARGVQNKVLEAMAMNVPVVATPQAIEGLKATGENPLRVAASLDEWVEQTLAALQSARDDRWDRRLRQWVTAHYAWDEKLARLGRILESTNQTSPGSGI